MPSLRHQIAVQLVRLQPRALHPSMETIRALMDTFARFLPPPPEVERRTTRVGSMEAEWFVPAERHTQRVILYLHGGGYCAGSLRTHGALAARLALAGQAATLLIAYRLAPECPHPAALEDAVDGYRYLLQEHKPSRLLLAGDSAGGGLTLALLLSLMDTGLPLPAAAVCLSPWTDLATTGASATSGKIDDPMVRQSDLLEWSDRYAGGNDRHSPRISPLYGRFEGLPPLLIQVGSRELLLDDSRRVAERAREAGVDVTLEVYPDLMHVWQIFAPFVPEAGEAIESAGRWIRQRVPTLLDEDTPSQGDVS